MFRTKLLIAATAAMLIAGSSAGMAQGKPDAHHEDQGSAGDSTTSAQQAPGTMNMMDMMKMMSMMHANGGGQMGKAGMGGPCQEGMGMSERVEGRIAFLRAELKITDVQDKLWSAYADTLRSGAKQMKDSAGSAMMDSGGRGLMEQFEAREKALSACLESIKAERTALAPLFESMSQDQRKSAEELLGQGMGMMEPGMMQGGMMQGGMMQGGMMQGGMMQGAAASNSQ